MFNSFKTFLYVVISYLFYLFVCVFVVFCISVGLYVSMFFSVYICFCVCVCMQMFLQLKLIHRRNPRIWGFFSLLKMHESVLEYGCLSVEFQDFLYTTVSISVLFWLLLLLKISMNYVDPRRKAECFFK